MAKSNRRRGSRPRAISPRTWRALLPTAVLLILLASFAFPVLHQGDRLLSVDSSAPPSDAAPDLADIVHEQGTIDESIGAGPTRDDRFARLFEPLHGAGLALVGTCPPADQSDADGGDAVLDAYATALLRCTMWTGVGTGVGVADEIDSYALAPMADTTTDLDGSLLLGLEPRSPTQSADITALMPWWALSGPGTLLSAGATHTGGGMGGGGDAGAGGGGVYSGITRGSRTPHGLGNEIEDGEEPETPPGRIPDATTDPVDGLDADVDDEDTEPSGETEPAGDTSGPSGDRGNDISMFPPPGVLTIPGDEPGGETTAPESVPEPNAFLLAGAGLTALMITRRMRT